MSLELARLFLFLPWPLSCPDASTSSTSTTTAVAQLSDSSNVATSHCRGVHPLFLAFSLLVVGTALLTPHGSKIKISWSCVSMGGLLGINYRADSERAPQPSHQLCTLPQYLAPWRLKGVALKLMHQATPRHPLLRSVYATIILYCNSDDFSWALLHAVYLSLVSGELSAFTRTCKRVKAVDLGRLSAVQEEIAGEGDRGKRPSHTHPSPSHSLWALVTYTSFFPLARAHYQCELCMAGPTSQLDASHGLLRSRLQSPTWATSCAWNISRITASSPISSGPLPQTPWSSVLLLEALPSVGPWTRTVWPLIVSAHHPPLSYPPPLG